MSLPFPWAHNPNPQGMSDPKGLQPLCRNVLGTWTKWQELRPCWAWPAQGRMATALPSLNAEALEGAAEHGPPYPMLQDRGSMGLGQGWGERPGQDPGSRRQGAGNCKHGPGRPWEAPAHVASSHWTSLTKHKCRISRWQPQSKDL